MWHVLVDLAPWLLAGAAVAGLLHALVAPERLRRHLRGTPGVLKAVGIGVPLPLCSCGVIPVGLGLKRHGASDGAVVAFLISTPQTGVDSILVTASLLGMPFALFKVVSAAATGVVGGLLTQAFGDAAEPLPVAAPDGDSLPDRSLRGACRHAVDLLQSIWRWLAAGVVVSAAIQTWAPDNGLAEIAAAGPLATMLITLAISLPLYVCATASVPIAASLVAAGLPTGAALVFLMAGPASNTATLGAVYRTLGGRALAIYVATLVVGSIALGLTFDALFPAAAAGVAAHVHEHRHAGPWSAAAAVALLALLGRFAWHDVRRAWQRRQARREQAANLPSVEVDVAGMTCGNCTARLEQALRAAEGVTSAEVSLQPGRARVCGSITREQVRAIVSAAGFRPQT